MHHTTDEIHLLSLLTDHVTVLGPSCQLVLNLFVGYLCCIPSKTILMFFQPSKHPSHNFFCECAKKLHVNILKEKSYSYTT
jgi:hypothetical protein